MVPDGRPFRRKQVVGLNPQGRDTRASLEMVGAGDEIYKECPMGLIGGEYTSRNSRT